MQAEFRLSDETTRPTGASECCLADDLMLQAVMLRSYRVRPSMAWFTLHGRDSAEANCISSPAGSGAQWANLCGKAREPLSPVCPGGPSVLAGEG